MRVRMLSSWEERCGIAEYSRELAEALRRVPEVSELDVVPASFQRVTTREYSAMGRALSAGSVAHIQHSYAFFGGMHPLRSGWSALAGAVRRPLLVTVHELDQRATGLLRMPAWLERAYKREFNRSVFLHPAVGRWLVHAEELRAALLELGAPPGRITYRPIPVPSAPVNLPDPSEMRRRLELGGKRPLMILGFLSRRKGYETAFAALRELPPEWVLVAAGGEHAADRTGTEAWLRAEAASAGVADRFRVTGYLSAAELEQATAAAEFILAPFTAMSASASLSYALARGKAVLASDLPENRKLNCVHHLPVGEGSAWAACIRHLGEDPAARERLQAAARRYARENSYPALADSTVALYRQLIEENTSKS